MEEYTRDNRDGLVVKPELTPEQSALLQLTNQIDNAVISSFTDKLDVEDKQTLKEKLNRLLQKL